MVHISIHDTSLGVKTKFIISLIENTVFYIYINYYILDKK